MAEMTPLRRRMIEDMSIRNLSPVTQRCYLHVVMSFSRHFNCSPDRLGLTEVRAYQVHLVSTGVSWQAFNQTICAMRPIVCAQVASRSCAAKATWSIPREDTAWLVASGRLVDIAENRRRGACIVKPLASMIRPGSVTRRFFLSPSPPLPRRVGGDHIEENGRRIFRRLPVLRQATDVIIRKIGTQRGRALTPYRGRATAVCWSV
jgi:hypothetical protein